MTALTAGMLLLPRLRSGMTWEQVYEVAESRRSFVQDAVCWLERHRMLALQKTPKGMAVFLTKEGKRFQHHELVGKRFGQLVVLGFHEMGMQSHAVVWCYCDCGRIHETRADYLKNGDTRSCGCYKNRPSFRHGHAKDHRGRASSEYQTWSVAKRRAKVMGVGFGWPDFTDFIRDLGCRPKKHVLTRVDLGKGWERDNTVWALRADVTRRQRAGATRLPQKETT